MVPTNSLTPDLNVIVIDLEKSGFDEDKEIAKEFVSTIDKLVEAILPIIKYVDEPIASIRGIVVGKMEISDLKAVLGRDGCWYDIPESGVLQGNSNAWKYVIFSDLCDSLHKAIQSATDKKQEHLAAFDARRKLLAGIKTLIHGGEVTA
jgi:hypothetical protein